MKKKRVGIQIGERCLGLTVMEQRKKEWLVIKEVSESLHEGIVQQGEVVQPELLGIRLKELVQKHGLKLGRVNVFMEELPFFIRHLFLPEMPEKEVEQALRYQAQIEFPIEGDPLVFRYHQTGHQNMAGEDILNEYVLIAAYRHMLEPIQQAFQQAGLTIAGLGLEPEAIYRGLTHKELLNPEAGSYLLVKTGRSRLMLSVIHNHKLVYNRYLPMDKHMEWAREIERTVISWEAKEPGKRIEEIVLLKDEGDWERIRERLETVLAKTVKIVSPANAAGIGIALQEKEEALVWEQATSFKSVGLGKIPLVSIGLVALLLLFFYPYFQLTNLEREVAQIREEIEANRDIRQLVNEKERLLRFVRQLEEKILTLEAAHISPLAVLEEIDYASLDTTTRLTDILFDHDGVELSGFAREQRLVIDYLQTLQRNPTFSHVRLTHAIKNQEEVQFAIEARGQLTDRKD